MPATELPVMSARAFGGPLLVTVAYVVVYYLMITHQVVVKTRLRRAYRARGETFDRYLGGDREMLAADRVVGNMLEHMPAFLVLLWLNAIFVGPRGAALAGAAYVLSRLVYPLIMGRRLGKGVPPRIMFVTVIGYVVLAYFAVRLIVVVV
ncbi:MAG TPA: MAPEG family protein [Polyangia bacterium]